MRGFEKITEGIYMLRVPFEEIDTGVFLLRSPAGDILLDGGPSPEAAEAYILPALQQMQADICMVVRSHSHGDHSGGVQRIREAYGQAKIGLAEEDFPQDGKYLRLQDGDVLTERFRVIHLPGHTAECIALLDIKTNTLLTGDCLQLGGIGKYGVSFTDPKAYLRSVERVRTMGVERIVAAHNYAPYGFQANGKQAVKLFLDACTINK